MTIAERIVNWTGSAAVAIYIALYVVP